MWIEKRRLLDYWDAAGTAGDEVALATVVRVDGSSYRKPGATMLVTRSGRRTGMVSGGCLEGEVSRKIWWLTESGTGVYAYNTAFDDDGQAAYGLGCGGIVSLLLERGDAARGRVEAIRRSITVRTASAVVTVIGDGIGAGIGDGAVPVGLRVIVGEGDLRGPAVEQDNGPAGTLPTDVSEALKAAAFETLERGGSASMDLLVASGRLAVFAEYIAPPPMLFVFGAGDDAQPVAEFAAAMGWEVAVADGRSQLATAVRFPRAHRVVVLREPPWPELRMGAEDAAVLLTHSYQQDRDILTAILPLNLRYVGVLGPRRRTLQLLDDVGESLGSLPSESLDRLHSPAGLDLGAEGPEAIALSIIAEVQATFEGRPGAGLRLLSGAFAGVND